MSETIEIVNNQDVKTTLPESVTKGNGPLVEVDGIQVPTKFVTDGKINTAALVKSYQHMEKMKQPSTPATVIEDKPTNPIVDGKVANPGDNPVSTTPSLFTEEESLKWAEEVNAGGLSEESYKTLQSKGFSKDIVDTYIAGQKAIGNQQAEQVFALVGGKDNYSKMVAWSQKNLSKEDISRYNANLHTDNKEMSVRGLYALYEKSLAPKYISGGNAPVTSSYESMQEMMADIKNPAYQTDAHFRSKVEQKLKNSPNIR